MIDASMVTETSKEANWNRKADRRTGAQDYVLSQADALTKNLKGKTDIAPHLNL